MFTLGIIGEYLARMYERTMERPPYVVGEVCDAAGEATGIGNEARQRVGAR
jgi:hypothetical protein